MRPDDHVERLESLASRILDVHDRLTLADDLKEFILLLRRPGWTTPAEFLLTFGVLEQIEVGVTNLERLSTGLLEGARAVEVG